jgi:hypothetical protein
MPGDATGTCQRRPPGQYPRATKALIVYAQALRFRRSVQGSGRLAPEGSAGCAVAWSGFRTSCQLAGSCRGVARKTSHAAWWSRCACLGLSLGLAGLRCERGHDLLAWRAGRACLGLLRGLGGRRSARGHGPAVREGPGLVVVLAGGQAVVQHAQAVVGQVPGGGAVAVTALAAGRVPRSFWTADPYRIFTGKDGIR